VWSESQMCLKLWDTDDIIRAIKLKVEVTSVKPSSFQHVVLWQNCLLSLLRYVWHYNRYFAFARDNRTHPIL